MKLGYLVDNQDDFLERVRIVEGRDVPQIASTEDLYIAPNGEEIETDKLKALVTFYERRNGVASFGRKVIVQGYPKDDDTTRFLDSSYGHISYGNEVIPTEQILKLTQNPRI